MQCEIVQQFFERMDELARIQKNPRDYGTGIPVYQAEMAVLDMIHFYPEMNVSAISEKMNVTKSAVTQITAKLIEKGLIEKYAAAKNKKERFFNLTDTGKQVRDGYKEFHSSANQKMKNYLCALDAHDKAVLIHFFDMLADCSPFSAFPCQRNNQCITEETLSNYLNEKGNK